jgi:hypothetical protein
MNEHELQRQSKHRLAILRHVEEVTGNGALAIVSVPDQRETTGSVPSHAGFRPRHNVPLRRLAKPAS